MSEFNVITAVGLPGSGKSELSRAIQENYDYYLFDSTWLRQQFAKYKGRPQSDRFEMRNFILRLKETRGNDVIYRQAVKEARMAQAVGCIIDGLRDPDDIQSLKADGGLVVAVSAPDPQTEYARLIKRGRLGDVIDYDDFIMQRELELTGYMPPLNTGSALEQADVTVTNHDIPDPRLRKRSFTNLAWAVIDYSK